MDITSLLSDFKSQLNISEHDLDVLSGFFRFLINQSDASQAPIPYGLLVEYDEEASKNEFLDILESVLKELPSSRAYYLAGTDEDTFSKISLVRRHAPSEEIFVLTRCSAQKSLTHLISEFENTPGTIKIVCASSEIIEKRLKKNEHFFYRILSRHIRLGKPGSQTITGQFLKVLDDKGYRTTPEFREEIAYYIDSIYKTADLKDRVFIADLVRRVELQMEEGEGISTYQNELAIDAAFIPYSRIVQDRKKSERISSAEKSSNTQPSSPVETSSPAETVAENEAENHVQTHHFDTAHDHTNVLLLALSSFQKRISKSEFKYDFDGCQGQVIGRYQLDPVPKMLDELFAAKEENLDQIIMLCTDKATMEVPVVTPEGETVTISPAAYFQNQVRNYMNPDLTDEERFITIDISLDSPYDGIQKVLHTLRGVPNPQLYLDTHGGLRGIQRILEATVSLLKIEGLEVRDAYAVEFTEGSAANLIISETENMKIFDFVSGINEFISCGRADTLTDYYKDQRSQALTTKENTQEKELIGIIQTVANGIQWCCVPEFENGLRKLQEYFAQNSLTEDKRLSYLDLYINDIKNDYQNLVSAKHTVADEIKWCLKKKFYQQALTLIESKISKLLIQEWKILEINHSTLLYSISEEPDENGKYTVETSSGKHAQMELNEIFNGFVYRIVKKDQKPAIPFLDSAKFNSMTDEDYRNFLDVVSNCPVSESFIDTTLKKASGKTSVYSSNHFFDLRYVIDYSRVSDKKIFLQILILHKALKDVRNTMNHASSTATYDLGAIVRALKYYMDWINALKPDEPYE